ncbi:MAG TPA: alpha/beta hydrolase, partial [Pseudonocardiaceae bacterium]|nr:alpha/beta hydrolase [Pseudonocardiaceae bacterium]
MTVFVRSTGFSWEESRGRVESTRQAVRHFEAGCLGGVGEGEGEQGLGLSDPVSPATPPTVGQWVQDAVAVLDASGAARVPVLANGDTGLIALLLAATHPERVASLTLINSYARMVAGEDYPHGDSPSVNDVLREIRITDTRPVVDVLSWIAPSVAGDARFRSWWDAVGRRGASPRTAELVHREVLQADVRDVLARVRVPVLALSR